MTKEKQQSKNPETDNNTKTNPDNKADTSPNNTNTLPDEAIAKEQIEVISQMILSHDECSIVIGKEEKSAITEEEFKIKLERILA